jgi:hypothetical protein
VAKTQHLCYVTAFLCIFECRRTSFTLSPEETGGEVR